METLEFSVVVSGAAGFHGGPRGWPGRGGEGRNAQCAQCGTGDPSTRTPHSSCIRSSSAPHPPVLYAVLSKILFGEKSLM